MDTIFINSENSRTSEYHVLLLNITNKIDLKTSNSKNFFLKTSNSEFREIKVWFTDQKSRPLEVEDKINVTLIIK